MWITCEIWRKKVIAYNAKSDNKFYPVLKQELEVFKHKHGGLANLFIFNMLNKVYSFDYIMNSLSSNIFGKNWFSTKILVGLTIP